MTSLACFLDDRPRQDEARIRPRYGKVDIKYWTKDEALQIEVIEESAKTLSFNVTRCRYAELYESLGIRNIGTILSCTRDFALIEGFNPNISLNRTQTIMEGADFCDFRYRLI